MTVTDQSGLCADIKGAHCHQADGFVTFSEAGPTCAHHSVDTNCSTLLPQSFMEPAVAALNCHKDTPMAAFTLEQLAPCSTEPLAGTVYMRVL